MKLRITEPRLWYGWMLAGVLAAIALQMHSHAIARFIGPLGTGNMRLNGQWFI